MKINNLIFGLLFLVISCQGKTQNKIIAQNVITEPTTTVNQKIQVAILLDTSGRKRIYNS